MIDSILTADDLKEYDDAGTCDIFGIDPYDLIKHKVNHHQDNTDTTIVSNFFAGYTGKFLLIGANNGVDQTYPLLLNGWKGYYCEPAPTACSELIKTTKNFSNNVTIINSAITPHGGIQNFFVSTDASGCSSLVPGWIEKHNFTSQRKILTNTIKFQDLLTIIGTDFDLIVMDAEGTDIELCESIDWSQFTKCKMLCLEAGASVLKQVYKEGKFILTDRTPTNAFYKKIKYLNLVNGEFNE